MRKFAIILGLALAATVLATRTQLISILRSDAKLGKQAGGWFLVTTNQLIRPWGEQMPIAGRPVDFAFDSQKRVLAVLNWHGVDFFDASSGAPLRQIPEKSVSYTGVAFRPDDEELWASSATRRGSDMMVIASLSDSGIPEKVFHMVLPDHPVPAGIAFSPDSGFAFVAFSRNNTLAVIDTQSREIRQEVPVGMAPFGVIFSRKQNRIFVSNRGGRRPVAGDTTAPSSGSNIVTDPVTGSTTTGTVTVIDLPTLRTDEVEVGLAPSGMALSPDENTLAVANGHSDSVTFIDTRTLASESVAIPTWPPNTLGSQPVAVTFSPDDRLVYVACAGNNAIALVTRRAGDWFVSGAIPTGWFPSAIGIGPEGDLRVVNVKGMGNTATGTGVFRSTHYEGSLVRIPPPTPAQVASGTREVAAANSPKFEPAGGIANLPSLGIQHVFLIVKENRTYDQVLGDMGKGNSDPALVMYGRDVTPNHHALAAKYVLLDNFYTGGAISFDGHQWLMQAFVSDYVERALTSAPRGYAWNMVDALTVSPAGFFWQGAPRPLDVHIDGEFCLPARWDSQRQMAVDMNEGDQQPWSEYWKMYKEHRWRNDVACRCGVPALAPFSNPHYPNGSLRIPDQIRAEEFLQELASAGKSGHLANVSILTLNNDHTAGTAPGLPTPRAMVADDDLALGRIVEGISKSPFWKTSLILVVEDDAQDGVDHVDGHRTVALAIGPNVRRGVVDSNNYNHTSMIRTIQEIFQIPARTRFLANARSMTSIFTAQADLSPYTHLDPKVRLDEMNPPLQALRGWELWAARQSSAMNWSHPDDIRQDVLNHILWGTSKGSATPYPANRHNP